MSVSIGLALVESDIALRTRNVFAAVSTRTTPSDSREAARALIITTYGYQSAARADATPKDDIQLEQRT